MKKDLILSTFEVIVNSIKFNDMVATATPQELDKFLEEHPVHEGFDGVVPFRFYNRDDDRVYEVTDFDIDDSFNVYLTYKQLKRGFLSGLRENQLILPFEYEVSQTEPDMAYTPKDIIENFMRGKPMNLSQNQEYDSDRYGVNNESLHELQEFEDEFDAMEYAKLKDQEAREREIKAKAAAAKAKAEKPADNPDAKPSDASQS